MKVSVLSYNMFLRPPAVRSNGCSDHKADRLREFFSDARLGRYDVLCFQELFSFLTSRRELALELATARGYIYHAVMPGKTWRDVFRLKVIDSGLVIASRVPITKTRSVVFKVGCDIDAFTHKGCLGATIVSEAGVSVEIVTTHLQASYVNSSGAKKAKQQKVRLAQLEELRRFIEDSDADVVLLAGDLNVDGRDDEQYASLCKSIFATGVWEHVVDSVFQHTGEHPITVGDVQDPRHEADPMPGQEAVAGAEKQKQEAAMKNKKSKKEIQEEQEQMQSGVCPTEKVLTGKMDWCCQKSLDFIFALQKRNLVATTSASVSDFATATSDGSESFDGCEVLSRRRFEVIDAGCEPFFVENKPFKQLSDHYSVYADLKILASPSA
eukprot:ANDGO_01870.mRNA.1 Sphingomyelinase DDB_G0288017